MQRNGRLRRFERLYRVATFKSNGVPALAIIELTDEKLEKQSAVRGTYATPTLKEFGPVGALTQGGSAPGTEAGGTMAATPMM